MDVEKRVEDRLDELEHIRNTKGLTKKRFAKQIGCSRYAYGNWLAGRHRPDLEHWIIIHDYIQDYFGGRR